MIVTPIKTHTITTKDTSLLKVLDKHLKEFKDKSILVITSKVVSICEGNVVEKRAGLERDDLVPAESEWYIPREYNKWGFCLSISRNTLIASGGIDESNADNQYVLWPKDPQKSANEVREYLVKRFNVKYAGVVIIDSHTTPLRWGVTGIGISHSGFKALKKYIGTPDLFGRDFKVTNQNIMDGISAAAGLVMGEGRESTPLVLVEDLPFAEFQDRNPTKEEIDHLAIDREEDVYWGILKFAPWKKGKKS
jgi:putative folate metabolism gamma-glutamate ligase